MTEHEYDPTQYDAVLGGYSPPRRKIERIVRAKLRIDAASPLDADEVITALGPSIEVLVGTERDYPTFKGHGVLRYVEIATVPDTEVERLQQRIQELEAEVRRLIAER